MKGKICGMDIEGNSSILSFHPEGLLSNPNKPFNVPKQTEANPSYAPKWLHPRCGARFGFGNKLVTFSSTTGGLLKVHHKKINPTLAERIVNFD